MMAPKPETPNPYHFLQSKLSQKASADKPTTINKIPTKKDRYESGLFLALEIILHRHEQQLQRG